MTAEQAGRERDRDMQKREAAVGKSMQPREEKQFVCKRVIKCDKEMRCHQPL